MVQFLIVHEHARALVLLPVARPCQINLPARLRPHHLYAEDAAREARAGREVRGVRDPCDRCGVVLYCARAHHRFGQSLGPAPHVIHQIHKVRKRHLSVLVIIQVLPHVVKRLLGHFDVECADGAAEVVFPEGAALVSVQEPEPLCGPLEALVQLLTQRDDVVPVARRHAFYFGLLAPARHRVPHNRLLFCVRRDPEHLCEGVEVGLVEGCRFEHSTAPALPVHPPLR
mmetsp:Transcript_23164/g.52520  ORF Transcript_23164/g.52520 Transcript_23164/m.52520 type:complete len:228 (-) Transcript_23164:139-822(-)